MGVSGLLQLLLRAEKALGRGSGAELIAEVKDLFGDRILFVEPLSHAGELVALPGKDKCYFTHCAALRRMGSASSITSLTISAALCSL